MTLQQAALQFNDMYAQESRVIEPKDPWTIEGIQYQKLVIDNEMTLAGKVVVGNFTYICYQCTNLDPEKSMGWKPIPSQHRPYGNY